MHDAGVLLPLYKEKKIIKISINSQKIIISAKVFSALMIKANNNNTIGDYATLDTLGKGLTDTLGGIHTDLGYTVLEEQLGTFKKEPIHNPHAYDNTSNYNTGINPKTVDGVTSYGTGISGKFSQDQKQPIFLQKDFDGVANIFAPNIIVQNPPLTSDGYPDISFEM